MTEKVALITGGAQRIGAALCKALHHSGYNIIIHYAKSEDAAKHLCKELNRIRDDSAATHQAQLNSPEELSKLAESARSQWGRIDALINNASIFEPDHSSSETEEPNIAQWQTTFDTNVRANYLLSKKLQSELGKRRGSIINLIDIYSERPLKGHSIYSASKAACAMLTKSLAREFAPNVRVNGISPGAILWPDNAIDESYKTELLNKVPLARLGSTDNIVETALYLLKCDYITGQIINIDGGRSLSI